MTLTWTPCLDARGQPKKRYVSEHAAKADLAHSRKWQRRANWPVLYRCAACKGLHLTKGGEL
jgi:hypothetical protein